MYKNVAEEILAQMGGRVFVKMTGVKDLRTTNGENLIMTLPKNNSGANRLEISLDYDTDTYNVRFFKYTSPHINIRTGAFISEKTKEIKSFDLVYCDMLQNLFTHVTGLETRMPRIIGINC